MIDMIKSLPQLALILVALLLVGCGDNKDQPKPDPVRVPKVLNQQALINEAPSWAAWLGPPSRKQRLVKTPSADSMSLVYLSGSDIKRAQYGQAPRASVTVTSQRSNKEINLKKILKPRRTIETPIGAAIIQPDGRSAYIISGKRAVSVQVTNPATMRTSLAKLQWIGDAVNIDFDKYDPVEGWRR